MLILILGENRVLENLHRHFLVTGYWLLVTSQ